MPYFFSNYKLDDTTDLLLLQLWKLKLVQNVISVTSLRHWNEVMLLRKHIHDVIGIGAW